MEDAIVDRPIAEKADDDLRRLPHLDPHRRSCGDGDTPTNDSVRTQVLQCQAGDVHRSTPAPTVACFSAKEFRHHQTQVMTLGNGVAVAAMCAYDVVFRIQRRDNARSHRLLAYVLV